MSAARIGIADIGVATPLGIGKIATAHALLQDPRPALTAIPDLVPGRVVHAGVMHQDLPDIPQELHPWASRNNRLALAALAEMRSGLEAARLRFGASRIAVVLGTSTSGIAEGEAAFATVTRTGAWPDGFDYRQQECGSLAEFVARALGLTGPAYTISTACSSSGKAFASARRLMLSGVVDAALVGGCDTLCRMTAGGFAALEAMSKGRCNPFSDNRDGINIGEGAAFFLLTPDRAAVELTGIGESSDAHHVSAPHPEGRGAREAMQAALADGALAPEDIGYLNLHGTATPLNDVMEGKAVHAVFGTRVAVSSTKAMTGHMLGAASAAEAAFLWLTLHRKYNPLGLLPAHLWDGARDEAIPVLTLTSPGQTFPASGIRRALSNSFAFGGSNVALVLAEGGHA